MSDELQLISDNQALLLSHVNGLNQYIRRLIAAATQVERKTADLLWELRVMRGQR